MENKQSAGTPVSLLEYSVLDWRKHESELYQHTAEVAQHPTDEVELSTREEYVISEMEAIAVMDELKMSGDAVAYAAETIGKIMREFVADDEDFQPTSDLELRAWLEAVVIREHPALSETDRAWLFDQILDFPPIK